MTIHRASAQPRNPTPAQVDDAVVQLEHDFVEIACQELGLGEIDAQPIAEAFVRGLRKRYGGMRLGGRGHIYVPAPSKAERDEAIRSDWTGNNMGEVMKRHGIKRSRVYQILRDRPGAPRIGVSGPACPISPPESGRESD